MYHSRSWWRMICVVYSTVCLQAFMVLFLHAQSRVVLVLFTQPSDSLLETQVSEEDLMIRFRGLLSFDIQHFLPTLLCSWLILGWSVQREGTQPGWSLNAAWTPQQQIPSRQLCALLMKESFSIDIHRQFAHGLSDVVAFCSFALSCK